MIQEQTLILETVQADLSSQTVGGMFMDSSLFNAEAPWETMVNSLNYTRPVSVLHAQFNGWRLIGPPQQQSDGCWKWWFTRVLG